jgi:hypothetical protein
VRADAKPDLGIGVAAVVALLALCVALTLQPLPVLALAAGCVFLLLPFRAPVATVVLIVLVTAVVPYSVQNQLGIGPDKAGLILSDVLLIPALMRSGFLLLRAPLTPRQKGTIGVIIAFCAVVCLQFVRSLLSGANVSDAGAELRTLLGFSVCLVALPLLGDEGSKRRLLGGLCAVGLVLGLWGIFLWFAGVDFGESGFGVREGVSFTSAGRGQLQGNMYAFPVAVVLAFAALVSGRLRSAGGRVLAGVVLLLNVACLILTFERTFWVATVLAVGFVTVRTGSSARARALLFVPGVVLVAFAVLSTFAPGTLTTARERLLSLGQYRTDSSLHYRIVESRHVMEKIGDHPIIGSALGDTIYWSRPWDLVPGESYTYSHNGYLWLAWKVGLLVSVPLFMLLFAAICFRWPSDEPSLWDVTGRGAQGALLVLMLASVTFPSFNTYGITPTMGLLLAVITTPSGASLESELPAESRSGVAY